MRLRKLLSAILLAALVPAVTCAPEPPSVEERAPEPSESLPPYSRDPFGHPFRWLSLGKLKYLEVVLGGADPDEPLPLVVVFHGLGDRPRVASEPEPAEFRARVLLPEAPQPFGEGRAWVPIRVRDDRPEDMAKALRQTSLELDGFLTAAQERYPSPCLPLVAGFSQGGIVAWALTARHPQAMLASFPMAAWLPPELAELSVERARELPPLRTMHGELDEVVPFTATRSLVEALDARGVDIELEAIPGVGHEFTDEMKRRFASYIEDAAARCKDAPAKPPRRSAGAAVRDDPSPYGVRARKLTPHPSG